MVSIVDDLSGFGRQYFVNDKSNTTLCLADYVKWAERQTGKKLKKIRTDQGGEFTGSKPDHLKNFETFCKNKGIEHQLAMAHTPEQNGRAERWQQTVVNKAKTLLHNAGLSYGFWLEAI